MPELSNPPVRNKEHSMEFLIGQHSLFLAGIGQSFFYLHQFKPYLPIWAATAFLLIPWAIVFILFYHNRSPFSPRLIRHWWIVAAIASSFFTFSAEAIWALGLMPPPGPDHTILADAFVQALMNLCWLSFVPMIRDHRNNPELWA